MHNVQSLASRAVRFIERVEDGAYTPWRCEAASLLRVGLGIVAAVFFGIHLRQAPLVWGPHGIVDWSYYANHDGRFLFALYALSPSLSWTLIIVASGLVAAVLFALGVLPRLTGIALFILVRATFDRNAMAVDGGDNVLAIMLLYLCFVDTSRTCVTLNWTPGFLRAGLERGKLRDAVVLVHNAAMVAIAAQLSIIYFWSGFYKIQGDRWADGTAIYYVMRVNEFALPGISNHIYEHGYLMLALAYATIILQMSFPFLMWNRWCKVPLFLGMMGFHVGIAVFMGLLYFSLTLIVVDLAILPDELIARVRSTVSRLAARAPAAKTLVVRDA
jgi:hypothetical protein